MDVSNSWLHDCCMAGDDWSSLHAESEQWKEEPAMPRDFADLQDVAAKTRVIIALDDIVLVRVAEEITHAESPEVVITFLTSQEAHVFHGKIARDFLSTYEQYIRDRQLRRPAE
jgi:hypothetical protein